MTLQVRAVDQPICFRVQYRLKNGICSSLRSLAPLEKSAGLRDDVTTQGPPLAATKMKLVPDDPKVPVMRFWMQKQTPRPGRGVCHVPDGEQAGQRSCWARVYGPQEPLGPLPDEEATPTKTG